MKVCLVVGHTEKEQGAENLSFGLTEYTYNMELVKHIQAHVKHECVVIHDKHFTELPKAINEVKPNICINLHCNAFNKLVSGTETLYFHSSHNGKRLANLVQDAMDEVMQLRDRGIKGIEGDERGGYVLRKTICPCIIVEPGFIDNDVDCIVLMENLEALGKAIAEAINDYFN